MFLKDIKAVSNVKWGASYLWDIKFDSAPAPFNEWFPATSVQEGIATVNSHSFEAGVSTYDFPKSTASHTVAVTFLDDENCTLQNWMSDWINTRIFMESGTGRCVNYLTDSVEMMHLLKMDRSRKMIKQDIYWVYPEGEITYSGTSESGPVEFTVTFRVAGHGD